MPEYLTFQLAAPLGAMGELTVGERRGSWDRPGRSAVLGLVAACLGLDRSDEAAQLALEDGYGLALRIETCGPVLADYHTAQMPPARRNRRFATRAEELAAPDLNTVLSRRDYRADLLVFAALWPRDASVRWPLDALAGALRRPGFTPYFGRKSCPLMLPLAPAIAPAEDPVAALAARAAAFVELAKMQALAALLPCPDKAATVALDAGDVRGRADVARREWRRDRLVSRRRWQFGLREEAVIPVR